MICACGRHEALWTVLTPPVCLECVLPAYEHTGWQIPDAHWQSMSQLIGRLLATDPELRPALHHVLLRMEAALAGGTR